jgi:hypothetical protein
MSNEHRRPSLLANESGGASVWMIGFIIFAGVSVDSANGWRHRAILQATADAAVLAATIELPDQSGAAASAQALAQANMASIDHGGVLAEQDVEFGAWNAETGAFTADTAPNDAVRVRVRRSTANNNPLPTYFLRLSGLFSWNVGAEAVATRYYPECLNDGLFARGFVNISSNNNFSGDICVHGQKYVAVNNNNFWALSVSVSMPNVSDFVIPGGGWASNTNITEVLKEEWFDPKLVDRIDEIIDSLQDVSSDWIPDYINRNEAVITVVGLSEFNPATLLPGRIYVILCGGPNKNINMGNGANVSNVVLIADCKFSLGNTATYRNAIIASTAGGPGKLQENLISVGQGTILGADDECTSGGGVILISTASVDGAAGSRYHGVQILAAGNISLAAGQGAIEGLQAQAGGNISFTSNNVIGTCAGGVDGYKVPYYRLVH